MAVFISGGYSANNTECVDLLSLKLYGLEPKGSLNRLQFYALRVVRVDHGILCQEIPFVFECLV